METAVTIIALYALSASLLNLRRLRARFSAAHREARTDALTGLGNRLQWDESTRRMQRSGEGFSFVLFDVANLKAMNTVLGHNGADIALSLIAAEIRDGELVGDRIGGDEFAIALRGASLAEARVARDRIEAAVGVIELAPKVSVFLAGEAGEWSPGDELPAAMAVADFELERRKAVRKSSLGLPMTREDTLAVSPRTSPRGRHAR